MDAQTNHPYDLARILFALSDPIRLKIITYFYAHDNMPCSQLELSIAKSTRSQHFKVLTQAGLISMQPVGVHKVVSVRTAAVDRAFPGLLTTIIQNAEHKNG